MGLFTTKKTTTEEAPASPEALAAHECIRRHRQAARDLAAAMLSMRAANEIKAGGAYQNLPDIPHLQCRDGWSLYYLRSVLALDSDAMCPEITEVLAIIDAEAKARQAEQDRIARTAAARQSVPRFQSTGMPIIQKEPERVQPPRTFRIVPAKETDTLPEPTFGH